MQIQVHTDHNIEGRQALATNVSEVVASALGRFGDRITRVEVHLSDDNGGKSRGDDKRCLIEARVEGHHPVAVTHLASTVDQAVDGAADKLARLIEHTLGRRRELENRRTVLPNEYSSGSPGWCR